jgi:anaerobic magnesium-protoporphyrin IX monomethyl ester cyclase
MKTLLLNAPWSASGLYGVRAGSRWPHLEDCATGEYMPFPFFMAYAAAILERAEKRVAVIDACAEKLNDDECLSRIGRIDPKLIVLETATPTIDIDLIFASKIRATFPDILIAFSGPHAPMLETNFLETFSQVDFVFRGEYEFIVLDVVMALEAGREVRGIPGVIHRDLAGRVLDEGSRPLLDLGELPWPARHLFDMNLYSDRPGGIPHPCLTMLTSRGCPFHCVFCIWPQVMYGGNKYRARNPVDVVDELEYCVKKWPFKSFYFDDDTFNIGKNRILALCREIKSRDINLPWAVMARADLVDEEILGAMKGSGLVSIKYGMESGVQELIDASGKRLKIADVENAVEISKKLGIQVHLTFAFGLPGETAETIRKTIAKAIELDPFSVQFSIATPFPGTSYYHDLSAKGHMIVDDWSQFSGSTGAVHRTDSLTKEDLDQCVTDAYRAWNTHLAKSPKRWPELLSRASRNPAQALRGLLKLIISGRR